MQAAASRFTKGVKDFSNFCKIDLMSNQNFMIDINSFSIRACGEEYGHYVAEVTARSFLYNQVRSMMAVLFLVGEGRETEEIVDELFDTEKHPRKPIYTLADPYNLVLADCGYPEGTFNWVTSTYSKDMNAKILSHSAQSSLLKGLRNKEMEDYMTGSSGAPLPSCTPRLSSKKVIYNYKIQHFSLLIYVFNYH
jgi:hypothetical protein